jgi:hypothetical protein
LRSAGFPSKVPIREMGISHCEMRRKEGSVPNIR